MRAALGHLAAERLDKGAIVSAWVVFAPDGVIAEHVNASSITDNGTGDWTVNWIVPFSNANWAAVGSARGTAQTVTVAIKQSVALTSTSVNLVAGNGTGSLTDPAGSPQLYVGGIGH